VGTAATNTAEESGMMIMTKHLIHCIRYVAGMSTTILVDHNPDDHRMVDTCMMVVGALSQARDSTNGGDSDNPPAALATGSASNFEFT
jgi:hypothetical protein